MAGCAHLHLVLPFCFVVFPLSDTSWRHFPVNTKTAFSLLVPAAWCSTEWVQHKLCIYSPGKGVCGRMICHTNQDPFKSESVVSVSNYTGAKLETVPGRLGHRVAPWGWTWGCQSVFCGYNSAVNFNVHMHNWVHPHKSPGQRASALWSGWKLPICPLWEQCWLFSSSQLGPQNMLSDLWLFADPNRWEAASELVLMCICCEWGWICLRILFMFLFLWLVFSNPLPIFFLLSVYKSHFWAFCELERWFKMQIFSPAGCVRPKIRAFVPRRENCATQ